MVNVRLIRKTWICDHYRKGKEKLVIALNCTNNNNTCMVSAKLTTGWRVWKIVCLALIHYPSIQTNAINHTRPREFYMPSRLQQIHKTLWCLI